MRVYKLAQDLKAEGHDIEGRDVMSLCIELGIPTRGNSALASISDDDAERVRQYLKDQRSGNRRSTASKTPSLEPIRPTSSEKRVPTLPSRPKRAAAAEVPEKTDEPSKESPEGTVELKSTVAADSAEKTKTASGKTASAKKPSVEEETPTVVIATKGDDSGKADETSTVVTDSEKEKPAMETPETVSAEETAARTAAEETKEQPESTEESAGTKKAKSTKETAAVQDSESGETDGTTDKRTTRRSRRTAEDKGTASKREKESKKPAEFSRPISVAEKIAQQAGELNAPVRPDTTASFPPLYPVRTLRDRGQQSSSTTTAERHKESKENRPTIRLAPLPEAKLPTRTKKKEPEAQKPEARLDEKTIRAAMAGDDSLLKKAAQDALEKEAKGKETRTGRDQSGRDRDGRDEGRGESRNRDRDGRSGRDEGRGRDGREDRKRHADDRSSRGSMSSQDMGKSRKGGKTYGNRDEEDGRDSRLGGKHRRSGMTDRASRMEDEGTYVRQRNKMVRTGTNTAAPRKSNYVLQLPLTVRSFSETVGLSSAKVIGKLFEWGNPLPITANLDEDTALLLADAFEIPVEIRPEVTLEEKLIGAFEEEEDDPSQLVPRPPVVTFLGHVDHGKTSLLDRIIHIDVVSGEKGGITQHIRAYNVKYQDRSVTFVDTPGHEAFTEMRARGANCTDIAVLVVAADDGVMPQTEEAISHAKAAGVPVVVALNKIDLPGINEMRILQELATNGLTPSEWGGDTEVVRCSALTGQGIDDLMETILTVAELQDYRANPTKPASGICIESSVQQGRGVIAKLLVQNGTLRPGDVLVCGATCGKVKVMADTLVPRKRYEEAGPAFPVNVLGLDQAPGAGDKFYVLDNIADARRLAEERAEEMRLAQISGSTKSHVTLEGLFETLKNRDEVQTLNVILRSDVRGSIEAIRKELGKLEHPEVQVQILQASVGGITEADVQLADASDAIIVGFNVVPDEKARALAEEKGVQIRRYDIIYQLTADIKAALEGMLKPEEREKETGRAIVQRTFQISHVGTIAGCRVIAGTILRDCSVRIIRDGRIIGTYPIDTLRHVKDNVKEVREGYECGIRLAGFNDIKDGDILLAYQVETVARTFEE